MTRCLPMVAAWTFILALAFVPFWTEARAQPPLNDSASAPGQTMTTPDWGPYPLLMSEFGELCTMCEAYVQCLPESDPLEQQASFSLYYFQTKTFWGQIATIWYYFAKWFAPITNEGRPAAVYKFNADGSPAGLSPLEAYLDVADARIEIDGTWIDRNTGEWFSMNNVSLGQCVRLGIPESMKAIDQAGPWQTTPQAGGATQ